MEMGFAGDLFADGECLEAADVCCHRYDDRALDPISLPPKLPSIRSREARSAAAMFGKALENSKIAASARRKTMLF